MWIGHWVDGDFSQRLYLESALVVQILQITVVLFHSQVSLLLLHSSIGDYWLKIIIWFGIFQNICLIFRCDWCLRIVWIANWVDPNFSHRPYLESALVVQILGCIGMIQRPIVFIGQVRDIWMRVVDADHLRDRPTALWSNTVLTLPGNSTVLRRYNEHTALSLEQTVLVRACFLKNYNVCDSWSDGEEEYVSNEPSFVSLWIFFINEPPAFCLTWMMNDEIVRR